MDKSKVEQLEDVMGDPSINSAEFDEVVRRIDRIKSM